MFRIVVLFRNEYPPSTDVGLHTGILNLLLDDGKLPAWNPYHMGGEPLANPPGFYTFASFIVFFTGMPMLAVQILMAAFFSSFAIFPVYLFSRKLWKNNSAAFLSALFVAVSSLSLEMLGWGGYPNIVGLTLIVIIFYIFFKDNEKPRFLNILAGALLIGSLTITHLLSFFVLLAILLLYFLVLLANRALKYIDGRSLNGLRFFFVGTALGLLLASPWLMGVSSFYLDMSSKGVFLGGMEGNRNLILLNRSVDISILAFIAVILPLLFLFKASRGRYVDSESLLLLTWILAALLLTQSYVVGIIVDYPRFKYYADIPGLVILSGFLFYTFHYILIATKKVTPTKWHRIGKITSQIALPAILLVICMISPLSTTPTKAAASTDFYMTVKKPEASGIEWVRQRTPNSAVLTTDHLYGWWLSGVAQRSTLSAVSPEFLLYPNEIEVATSALILLDTDYYLDNGLIQVRDDGGYLARHNPIFIIDRNQQLPYSVFHFNDDEINLFIQRGKNNQVLNLSDVDTIQTYLDNDNANAGVLSIIRENDLLRVNKTLVLRRGVNFAELSYEVEGMDGETTINWMRFILHLRESKIAIHPQMLSIFDYNAIVNGQIIFKGKFPQTKIFTREHPSSAEFLYSTNSSKSVKIEMLVGVSDVRNLTYEQILEMLDEPQDPMRTESDNNVVTLSYSEIIEDHGITFIVCRDQEVYPKFSKNPKFRAVYNSEQVAIFQVVK